MNIKNIVYYDVNRIVLYYIRDHVVTDVLYVANFITISHLPIHPIWKQIHETKYED